jgi:DNA end-binding protein Ku
VPKSANKSQAQREPRSDTERGPAGRRPAWSGSISFGLVSVPVELYSATRPRKLRARMLDAEGTPLTRRYYCPADQTELDDDDIVRGYELPNGEHVQVEDEELEALEPKKSREIDLRLFTRREQLNPAWFEQAYVLIPAAEGGKAYRLLAEVMHRTDRVGIATFVMRAREYIIAIFSDGRILLGETLRFADELRSPKEVGLPEPDDVSDKLRRRFEQLLSKGGKRRFDPKQLVDPGQAQLAKLLEAKRKRGDVVKLRAAAGGGEAPSESPGADVIDLMQMLKKSLKGDGDGAKKASKRKRD